MKVYIQAFENEKLTRSLFSLVQIFDAKATLSTDDWEICLIIQAKDEQYIGKLKKRMDGQDFTFVLPIRRNIPWTSNALNFQVRQLVYQLFCQAGFKKQPWGILTGIRPTKLVHKMQTLGMSQNEIFNVLQDEYFIHEDKVLLLQKIASMQRKRFPEWSEQNNRASVYIGIPFCPTKCAYCTFPDYQIPKNEQQVEQFLSALIEEIRQIGPFLPALTTVYIGGGTPTSLTVQQMQRLFYAIASYFPLEYVEEFTVEAGRPDTITEEKLRLFHTCGVTRISINPQSFHQDTLEAIGRLHQVEEIYQVYDLARKMGMNNINMDMILGLPGENYTKLLYTMSEVLRLSPESITVHTLALKRASQITQNRSAYQWNAGDEIEKMMESCRLQLENHGYLPYYLYRQKQMCGNLENIGYCKPGFESLYNILMMEELQTIVGFGCGASSKWVDRWTGKITQDHNPKDPKTLIENTEHYIEKKKERLKQIFVK